MFWRNDFGTFLLSSINSIADSVIKRSNLLLPTLPCYLNEKESLLSIMEIHWFCGKNPLVSLNRRERSILPEWQTWLAAPPSEGLIYP